MQAGGFPGRDHAFRELLAEQRREGRRTATRRMFFGLAFGGVLGACAGGAAMRRAGEPSSDADQPLDPRLDEARKLATGPLDELLRVQVSFVGKLCDVLPGDDPAWIGVTRLAQAIVDRDPRVKPGLKRVIVALVQRPEAPRQMAGLVDLLEAVR